MHHCKKPATSYLPSKYGFKPYTADTTFGANGLTFSPILTDDPQAT